MKITLSTTQLADYLREDFSYCAARALAEWLEEREAGSGEEMEFDHIAIRCDWSEHDSLSEWARDYFGGEAQALAALSVDSLDEADDAIREYINDNGSLIEFENGVLVSSF